MHLMRVDLPAPLSPTRDMTSPARTSKSTSVSACTEPKLLKMLRVSSIGVVVVLDAAEAMVSVTSALPGRQAGEPLARLPHPVRLP